MADAQQARMGHTITLILPESLASASDALDRWWVPIADAWPDAALCPAMTIITCAEARHALAESLGQAVIVVVDDSVDPAALFQLVDHIWEQELPGLLLFEELTPQRRRLGGRGIIPLAQSMPPAALAASLHALVERQATVEALRTELLTARRFQGGLRGEMDKIHEELQLAAAVQREFLPTSLPNADTLDIQVFFRPAGYVSGDMYDVRQLDEHRIGFFVADAVGHGVPAALMTMVLSRGLSSALSQNGDRRLVPPGQVLERLNREMIRRHGDVPRFATAVYGIVDTRDLAVTLAGAGHPPPLRCSRSAIRPVETDGCLLGVFPDDTFSEVSFTLEPDEVLVCYSDGFETAFPSQGDTPKERRIANKRYRDHFTQLAGAWADDSLATAMRSFADAVDHQSGSLHQIDDLTAIAIAPVAEALSGGGCRTLAA